mgnify:CR=1 FL=1
MVFVAAIIGAAICAVFLALLVVGVVRATWRYS